MTNVIALNFLRRSEATAPREISQDAEILFFTGVRYVRDQDDAFTAEIETSPCNDSIFELSGMETSDRLQA